MSNIEAENNVVNNKFSLLNLLPELPSLNLSKPKCLTSLLKTSMSVLLFMSVLALTFYAIPHSIEWLFAKKEFILELSNLIPNDEAEQIRFIANQVSSDTWHLAQEWTTWICQGMFLSTTLLGSIAFKIGSTFASKKAQKEIEVATAPLQETIFCLKNESNSLQEALKKQVELNEELPRLKEESEKFRQLLEIFQPTNQTPQSKY